MTTENSSQKKGVFKISGKEGDVFTVNLPDGSPRYILLQEVDDLVELLQENYQGSVKPINSIKELDGLLSISKEELLEKFVPYTTSTFAERMALEEMDSLMDILKQDDSEEEPSVSERPSMERICPSCEDAVKNFTVREGATSPYEYSDWLDEQGHPAVKIPKPFTATDPPTSNKEKEKRAESHETVPPVSDPTPTATKFNQTALQTQRPVNSDSDIIQLWQVNEGTSSPVASTYAGDWTIIREVERRDKAEEPQLCMQAAHMAARVNNGLFVQGTVIGEDGKRIVHAWAEIGDFAYDAVRSGGGVIMPIDEFYETHQAEDVEKLTSLEAEELHYEFDPSGFWGPYEEDEIESIRGQSNDNVLKDMTTSLNELLSKQMLEPNPQQPVSGTAAPPSPDDIVYSSQNSPPDENVATHTGVRGGEYWLRSEAMRAMNWDEDQMNTYLNTENEEIQGRDLETVQAERDELKEEVTRLRGMKNRRYRQYKSFQRALDRGEISEEEASAKRDAWKSAKDEWDEARVQFDLVDEELEGLTADRVDRPAEGGLEEIEPELDTTIENLKTLLKNDPEANGENKADIFSILDKWSEDAQTVRTEIDEAHDDDYYAHSDVQSAIEAISLVSENTNWRNLETITELPLVSNMILDGTLDSKLGVLSTRLNAYKVIGNNVLEHFEESYTLPSYSIEGTPSLQDWKQSPISDGTFKKLKETTALSSDMDTPDSYVWFTESQLRRKYTLTQMGAKSKLQYDKAVKDAKKYGDPLPDKQRYMQGAIKQDVTLEDILFNLNNIRKINAVNKSEGTRTPVPFTTKTRSDSPRRQFSLASYVLGNVEQIVLDELPDKFGPPSMSSDFRKKFADIVNPSIENPSLETDHIVSELYRSTQFSKFHEESSSAMENSTNSLLGGLIKDAIGTLTKSKIIHHGSKKLVDRNGNLVALEEGYKTYPKEKVLQYVKVHKNLTRQLLDYMYPDTDGIELYRGTQDAKLMAFAQPAITGRKEKFFRRLMSKGIEGASLMIAHNPVTLFSSKPLAAFDFATDQRVVRPPEIDDDQPVSDAATSQGGLVLVQQVPKDNIWSSYGTGHAGTLRKGTEGEFYVTGSGKPSTATAYLPADFYDYVQKQGGSFQKQQEQLQQDDKEDTDVVLIIDDEINSDWIQRVHELWEEHPDLGEKSHMPPVKVEPTDIDGPSTIGQKTKMPRIPVEREEIVETTPTVQKSYIAKQEELGRTLAQAEPDAPTVPKEEVPVHPAAQGKVRTMIYELVNRAGKTFERRRTAWVNPKVAEAINSRQKATDWLRLLGNYLPLYFVGGFVRDKLMGKVSSDVDIISLVPLEKVQETFDSLNIEYKKVSAKDKKILTLKIAGMDVDVAAAEAEDLPKDLMKRDFTINAVAQSVTGQFYDPSNGLKDIKEKVLRSPRNQSSQRFQEDPVRMMRAARFLGNYKLKVHPSVTRAIKKHKDKLEGMPDARIGRELAKIMETERPADAMEFMAEQGLLEAVDPALAKMVDYKQNTPHHKWNLWKHTMTALKKAESEDMVLNLAILFHDVGKPDAADENQSTFHGHEKQSAAHVAKVLKRLEFSDDVRKRVENLVGMHMRLLTVPETAKTGAFRRIKIQAGQDLDRLIALAKADSSGSGVEIEAKLKQLDVIIAKIKNIEDIPDKQNLSPITGKEIIEELDIKQGRQVGEIKEHLHNLVVDEELEATDKDSAIQEARKYMEMVNKELSELMGMLVNA